MISANSDSVIGEVKVFTTEYRGFSPEELAQHTVDKIISVGENSHPVIIEQAKAFREYMVIIIADALRQAQVAERTTICGQLIKAGREDISNIIRSL